MVSRKGRVKDTLQLISYIYSIDLVWPKFNFHIAAIYSEGLVFVVYTQGQALHSKLCIPIWWNTGDPVPISNFLTTSFQCLSLSAPRRDQLYQNSLMLCVEYRESLGPEIPSSWDPVISYHHLMMGILLLLFMVNSFILLIYVIVILLLIVIYCLFYCCCTIRSCPALFHPCYLCVVCGHILASHGSLLEIQTLRSHPGPSES